MRDLSSPALHAPAAAAQARASPVAAGEALRRAAPTACQARLGSSAGSADDHFRLRPIFNASKTMLQHDAARCAAPICRNTMTSRRVNFADESQCQMIIPRDSPDARDLSVVYCEAACANCRATSASGHSAKNNRTAIRRAALVLEKPFKGRPHGLAPHGLAAAAKMAQLRGHMITTPARRQAQASQTVPTGLPGTAPSGPAMPVTATATAPLRAGGHRPPWPGRQFADRACFRVPLATHRAGSTLDSLP